jgi:hypothetical protein
MRACVNWGRRKSRMCTTTRSCLSLRHLFPCKRGRCFTPTPSSRFVRVLPPKKTSTPRNTFFLHEYLRPGVCACFLFTLHEYLCPGVCACLLGVLLFLCLRFTFIDPRLSHKHTHTNSAFVCEPSPPPPSLPILSLSLSLSLCLAPPPPLPLFLSISLSISHSSFSLSS